MTQQKTLIHHPLKAMTIFQCIFQPNSNPTSGFIVLVPRKDIRPVDLTTEEALNGDFFGYHKPERSRNRQRVIEKKELMRDHYCGLINDAVAKATVELLGTIST